MTDLNALIRKAETGEDWAEICRLEAVTEADANWNRAMAGLKQTALTIKAERDRYEAALRKVASWKGYTITEDHEYERYQRGYEAGANDMLSTLQAMAREALS